MSKKPAPKTLGDCSAGDVVRVQTGTVKLTGRLQYGWLMRDWSPGNGVSGEVEYLEFETPVLRLVQDGQQIYAPSKDDDTDPLRGS